MVADVSFMNNWYAVFARFGLLGSFLVLPRFFAVGDWVGRASAPSSAPAAGLVAIGVGTVGAMVGDAISSAATGGT